MEELLKTLKKEWNDIFILLGTPLSEDIDTESLEAPVEDILTASNPFFNTTE